MFRVMFTESSHVIAIAVAAIGLLLVVINAVLWFRLKYQKRRRRISERQLELTLRRGTSSSASATGLMLVPAAAAAVDGCSRPTAVVRAVSDQCSSLDAVDQQPAMTSCCGTAEPPRVHGIATLPPSGRLSNQYEKLDYVTTRRLPIAPPPSSSSGCSSSSSGVSSASSSSSAVTTQSEGCGEAAAAAAGPPPIYALPKCLQQVATPCGGFQFDDVECCYEDIDGYLKPMGEECE